MKSGKVLRTILLFIIVATLIVYGGYGPFLSYMGYLSVKEKCKELAKFAGMYKNTDEIKNIVMKKLEEEGFYFSSFDVSVYYDGDNIVIRAIFSDTLRWFGDKIIKPLNYKMEVKRLPVSLN